MIGPNQPELMFKQNPFTGEKLFIIIVITREYSKIAER